MASLVQLFGRARWALPVALSLASGACGGDGDEAGSGGSGGSAGTPSGPSSLAFDPAETLTLVPGEVRSVAVVTKPPGHYLVRFALLGDASDAALDQSETTTDGSGRAEVAVTAPSSARTFSIRASSGDKLSTSVAVSVSASGFASLQVAPAYSGKRSVSHWVASARTGVSCAELSGELLTDGDLKGKAPFDKVPQVDDVPVGPAIAVTLRGAESIAGCKEVGNLSAGEIRSLTVPVFDLPMKLEGVALELELGLEGATGKWPELLQVNAALAALSPASNDASALLDAMQSQSADPAAFQAARKTGSWDAQVQGAIGGPNAIRSLVDPWLKQGAAAFAAPDALRGSLTSAAGSPTKAWLDLASAGGADATRAGFPSKYLTSWQAHPDDSVALGVELALLPSRLVTALALGPARAEVSGAPSVPDALADLLACKDVALTLVAAGSGPGEAYAKCDSVCAESLCREGLVELWALAADASAAPTAPVSTLSVAATATASVDDFARPFAFSGTWVGAFSTGSTSAPVSGAANAKKPGPPE